MDFQKLLNSKEGQIGISIILGLGLATMFRQSCKKGSCIVIQGPKLAEIQNTHYRLDDDCYKYSPYIVDCDSMTEIVSSE